MRSGSHRLGALWAFSLAWLALMQSLLDGGEPVYQGKTLTSWLSDFDFGRFQDAAKTAKNEAAERAVEAIGPAAVPVLVERLNTKSLASKRFLERIESLQRQEKTEEASNLVGSSMVDDINTVAAFRILGAKAKPAIPELIELLAPALHAAQFTGEPATELADRKSLAAADALAAIGPDAIPPLIEALKSEDVSIRFGAAMALESFGPDREIVTALVEALIDPDCDVRWRAVRTLGNFRAMPQVVVPAIAERLRNDSASTVRFYAVSALRKFGPAAQAAVRDLTEAASDPSLGLRREVEEALVKIRPVEASR